METKMHLKVSRRMLNQLNQLAEQLLNQGPEPSEPDAAAVHDKNHE